MKPSLRIRLVDLTLFGMLGALTFAAKLVMMGLPNIEPSSLMVMLFAVIFGKKAVYPIYVYVTLEILYFGINTWTICYLYIWLILAIGAWVLRDAEKIINSDGTSSFVPNADIFLAAFVALLAVWVVLVPLFKLAKKGEHHAH